MLHGMSKTILFCWLGNADLTAANRDACEGLGPIAQALTTMSFDEVVMLNDWGDAKGDKYIRWISNKTSVPINIQPIILSSPINFGEIYQACFKTISGEEKKYGSETKLVFHLSPGTPAMAAVWILLAKTRFQAELIESSKEYGVRTVSIPFDISMDFIPDILRKSDDKIARLATGLPSEAPEFKNILHRSEVMQRVILMARRIAPRSIPVLIEGESGTGKELFARAIHDASPRREKPFVAINCGAIPTELVESELFGHEKGAFTGAVSARIGHFEAAHHGTLFLDEIGELPKEMQVKLLRAIQEGEVKRIGSTQARQVDIRIIAATNRNLIEEVTAGNFREDLFYRLAVAVIKLPALRERSGDVSLLIDKLLERINHESSNEFGYKHKKISASARNILLRHPWPGNVRELQNTLTRATVWSMEDILDEKDIITALFPVPIKGNEHVLNKPLNEGFKLQTIMKMVAVHYLERGIDKAHGNKTKAAEILGLTSYQTLTNWLKKYGLE
jgi:transcriptional regulator with PAS, ATPase and Fis domain